MIIFDIIVILMSLVMMLVVVPKMMKKYSATKLSECIGCKCSLVDLVTNSTTSEEIDRAMKAHRRGTCDACQTQIDREEQLKEVFTPGIISTFNRKVDKLAKYKYTATIFFFTSAIFGIAPVHGSMLLAFKSIQVSLLALGWVVFFINFRRK